MKKLLIISLLLIGCKANETLSEGQVWFIIIVILIIIILFLLAKFFDNDDDNNKKEIVPTKTTDLADDKTQKELNARQKIKSLENEYTQLINLTL